MAITIKSLKALSRSGKQKLFLIPYFFTFSSALFGFLAVIKTLEYDFTGAAYCIMLACLMDTFDGKLARAFGSVSYIGMELDSLCDAVSFCFAPTILLYSWRLDELGVWGVVALACYLCFGLLRLARFNIFSTSSSQNIDFFVGLPTTLAALLIAQLIIHYQWISESLFWFLASGVGIVSLVAVIAFLMISTIKFPSFKSVKPTVLFFVGLGITILLFLSLVQSIPFFFLLVFSYISSCILYNLYVCVTPFRHNA